MCLAWLENDTGTDDTGMEIMEIILLIAGGLIFILSFFIPEGKGAAPGRETLSEDEINRLLAQELAAVRGRIDDMVREAAEDVMDQTERSLEKLSNEKIMAVSEYSDTVLSEIHKNHEEVVFLYDMLNNKHTSLKNTLGEINRTVKDAEEMRDCLEGQMLEGTGGYSGKQMSEEAEAVDAAQERFMAFGGKESLLDTATDARGMQADAGELQQILEDVSGTEKTEDGRSANARILDLYNQGRTIVEIAKELNRGIGEVKLVVELYKSQR